MKYDFRTLDPHDDSESNIAAINAWQKALMHGFHEGVPSDTQRALLIDCAKADNMRLAGAWLPEGEYAAGPMPVGTFSSWDSQLNTGAEMLPVHLISDVTVSPAHRRRGLLSQLMRDDLATTDLPLAALTVSEASIYGRFGFAASTFARRIEVDTTARFALRDFADPGRVELIEPGESWATHQAIFDRFHASQRGSIGRPHFYEPWKTGRHDFENDGPDRKLRVAVHLDPNGIPDAITTWKHVEGEGDRPAAVNAAILAANETAHLALWQFLAGIDLSRRVNVRSARLDDVLDWAVTNRDVVDVKAVRNHIWLRILDVPTALEARPWYADATLTIAVDDPWGHAHGTFEIVARDGRAKVAPTDAAPVATMSVEALGALYLGGVGVDTLARAGWVRGDATALAAVMDGGPAPYSMTSF